MARERLRRLAVALVVACVVAAPVSAHHSIDAEYDGRQPVTLRGVLTEVKWQNPHIWIFLDVREADGSANTWAIEGAPPSMMHRTGVEASWFKVGDRLTVNAYHARVGGRTQVHAFDVLLPDGRRVVIGRKLN